MLFGPNSGGKSSIIKALAYYGYILDKHAHPLSLKINTIDKIDYGIFNEINHKKTFGDHPVSLSGIFHVDNNEYIEKLRITIDARYNNEISINAHEIKVSYYLKLASEQLTIFGDKKDKDGLLGCTDYDGNSDISHLIQNIRRFTDYLKEI